MTPSTCSELPRKLNLMDAVLLVVGAVIGSGIFVVPSLIASRISEPGLVRAIWLFSGLLVLCGALTLAELGAMLPQSGGLYVYIREAYGTFWGFLYGWTNLLVVITAPVAALMAAFPMYLKYFLCAGILRPQRSQAGASGDDTFSDCDLRAHSAGPSIPAQPQELCSSCV